MSTKECVSPRESASLRTELLDGDTLDDIPAERLVPDAVPDDALMSPYKALATAVVTQALPDLARQAAEDLDAALEALQKLTAQEPWDIMAGRVGDGARDAHCGPGTATHTWRSGSGFLFDMNPTLMESEVLTELIIVSPARAPLPLSSAGWAVTPMTCP